MFFQNNSKIPIIVSITGGLGGITTWAFRLRDAFSNHPTYKILLMQSAVSQPSPGYDLFAPTLKMAFENIKQFHQAIIIPNFSFELIPMCIKLNQGGNDIRIIGVCHSDSEIEYYNPLSWFEPQIDQFITVSNKCDNELKRRIPHRASDITKLTCPVPVPASLPAINQKDSLKLVYAGRVIQAQKRVLDFIPLVKILAEKQVNFTFDLIGDGPELYEIKAALKDYIEKGIIFLPGVVAPDQMNQLWQNYDIFVQTSEYEGVSTSMLEAMAHGVVPVVTQVSGNDGEVLQPGINGFVFPIKNMEMAAHWIELLHNEPQFHNQMRAEAHLTAQNFSLANYVPKLIPVFEAAMNAAPRSWPQERSMIPKLPYREQETNWIKEGEKWSNRQRMMRTAAFVLPGGYTVGGTTTWSLQMCNLLQKRGVKSFILEHTVDENSYKSMETPWRYQVSNLRCAGKPPYHYQKDDLEFYAPVYNSVTPATIVPNWSVGAYATCAHLVKSDPNSLRVIGYAHSDEVYYYELLRYYEPIIHKFVAVSQEAGLRLLEYIPYRQMDIVVKPYAVNVPQTLAKVYANSDHPLRITYAGRLAQQQKRILDLVPLVEQLHYKKVNFKLQIVGDGPEGNLLQERMMALPRSVLEKVTFKGTIPLDAMEAIWKDSDVCILVSEYEGTSISMLEAMAQGVIPVVTQVSGTSAIITHNSNGLLSAVGDLEQMVENIRRLDINRTLISEMGYSAHKTISQRYSYEDYVSWFIDMIDEVWQLPHRKWPEGQSIHQYF
jgi:glycosyltransferase involved in cell wall biosynthesis